LWYIPQRYLLLFNVSIKLKRNIMTAVIMMDKYLPAIMCLHYTSLSPKHALANVEGEMAANLN